MANKYANGGTRNEVCNPRPKRETPQEVIRKAGYSDGFFNAAAALGIKAEKAEITAGNFLRIIFKGAQGNGFTTSQAFPIINGEPVCPHEIIGKLTTVRSTIAQHNRAIEVFKGTPKAEGIIALTP